MALRTSSNEQQACLVLNFSLSCFRMNAAPPAYGRVFFCLERSVSLAKVAWKLSSGTLKLRKRRLTRGRFTSTLDTYAFTPYTDS